MAHYKLMYFNVRARAETTRMLFALAEVEYDDVRIEKQDWPELKKQMPFGTIPVLVVDGKTEIAQSRAIERYVARKYGFAGKMELDQAKVDMIVYSIDEILVLLVEIYSVYKSGDREKSDKMLKDAREELISFKFECFEKILKSNNNGAGFLVGDELTWADVAMVYIRELISNCTAEPEDMSKYPLLQALNERTRKIPKLAEWIRTRPDTY